MRMRDRVQWVNIVTDTRLVPIGNSVTNTNTKYIESANKKGNTNYLFENVTHATNTCNKTSTAHSERHIIVLWLHYQLHCILWSLVSDLYFTGSHSSLNVWLCLRLLMSW